MKFFVAICTAILAGVLSGCQGVQSASIDVNPVTMTVGGSLVFKNGKWVREVRSANVCDDTREIQEVRGVRSVTGALISVRGQARAITANAKAVRAEERETFRALQEIHETEVRKLDTVIHAKSQSTGGKIRRAFSCTPSELPDVGSPTVIVPADIPGTPSQTVPPVTQPSTPSGDDLPPSGILKAQAASIESRVKILEDKVSRVDVNVLKLLEKLEEKK